MATFPTAITIKINGAVSGTVSGYTAPGNGYAIVQVNSNNTFTVGGVGFAAGSYTGLYVGPGHTVAAVLATVMTISGVSFVNN